METLIFKICSLSEWTAAVAVGNYAGSAIDQQDGFIHFSTRNQVAETARRHFAGQPGLVLIAFEAAALDPALWWEPARDGDLFPHLYATLKTDAALWVRPLALDAAGIPIIPEGVL